MTGYRGPVLAHQTRESGIRRGIWLRASLGICTQTGNPPAAIPPSHHSYRWATSPVTDVIKLLFSEIIAQHAYINLLSTLNQNSEVCSNNISTEVSKMTKLIYTI